MLGKADMIDLRIGRDVPWCLTEHPLDHPLHSLRPLYIWQICYMAEEAWVLPYRYRSWKVLG